MRNHIRRQKGPPLINIREPGLRSHRLVSDPPYRQADLVPNGGLPVPPQLRLRKGLGEQLPPPRVDLRVPDRKQAQRALLRKLLVPGALGEGRAGAVDLSEIGHRGDGDLLGGDAHDGAVALVQGVDVVDAAAGDDGEFEGQAG